MPIILLSSKRTEKRKKPWQNEVNPKTDTLQKKPKTGIVKGSCFLFVSCYRARSIPPQVEYNAPMMPHHCCTESPFWVSRPSAEADGSYVSGLCLPYGKNLLPQVSGRKAFLFPVNEMGFSSKPRCFLLRH